ncbi:hypothetical protein SteCoe_38409 [Stentor coeruleus]|uniref:ADP-ribosylation factor n=1 Tax=Stentor coeruleus TaxID=5963 RepID=A0A1R2ALH8_9CILI|nr:hypothetical protein SteCoe_38409 [Stentor coeruleus]
MGSEQPSDDFSAYRVLILGLESAGKTTILYRLKLNETVSAIPTIGFNVETVVHSTNKYTLWDLGGSHKTRCLWPHYYDDTNAIIFVIDANDESQFEDAKACLDAVLSINSLEKIPLLLLVNKSDIADTTVMKIIDVFNVFAIKNREWFVQKCSAITGEGLEEGLEWLDKIMEKLNKVITEAPEIEKKSEPIEPENSEPNEQIEPVNSEPIEPENKKLPDYRILLLGIQMVGKTTILYKLKCNCIMTTCQTIGFNVESITYNNNIFTIWDVGGVSVIRQLWRHYYFGTNGIIFVVDSSNNDDRNEEKNELNRILAEEELMGLPVLIFANKSSSAGENTESSLREFYGVDKIQGRKTGFIFGDCINGIGIEEMIEWLHNNVPNN